MINILLIEDENTIRENTLEILELEGFNAIGAENGVEGLNIINSETPDIIICDIHMPEMDGYEVIRRVKSNPDTKNIPFIFFTAKAEYESETMGLELGADSYLKKPVRNDYLLRIIDELYGRSTL